MADYPSLTEMGILHPDQIDRYSLHTVNNKDVLRVVYKRKPGSLLPSSKKYRFGRSERMVVTDSGRNETATVHEISPFLVKVVDELHRVIKAKHTAKAKPSAMGQRDVILEEIRRLEEESATRIAYLKELVKELK